MNFMPDGIAEYAESHTSPQPEVLHQLYRETHLKCLAPQMLSGHLQGRLLSMFSKMLRPQNILEIGTFTGYSAICLCEGLPEGGRLYTIDIDEELQSLQDKYFALSGCAPKIERIIGNALEIIPTLQPGFDLVFIDADKTNYVNYFELVIDKMPPGGIILADNVLWSGKVLEAAPEGSDTAGLQAYNKRIHTDPRVENVLLPIRDGIMVARKL